jgi:hypothetical protein
MLCDYLFAPITISNLGSGYSCSITMFDIVIFLGIKHKYDTSGTISINTQVLLGQACPQNPKQL